LAVFFLCCLAGHAIAEDVPFNPRFDAVDDEEPKKEKTAVVQEAAKPHPVYSFARWGLVFKDLCIGLENDGRQSRVYEVTKKAMTEEFGCSSCRALYRQFNLSCAPKVPPRLVKKKPTAVAPPPTPVAEAAGQGSGAEESGADDASAGANGTEEASDDEQAVSATPSVQEAAEPSPTPPLQAARYPRTEVIDAASRISMGLYEMEPGMGSTFKALQNFETRLLALPNLTVAERDYYGTLLSYLQAAWEGRPGSPLDPRVKANEDVSVLFQ
jgi:hypothetical protein